MVMQVIIMMEWTPREIPIRMWPCIRSMMELIICTPGTRNRTLVASAIWGVSPNWKMTAQAAAMEAVRELIDSGEWDVFSGVKLNITVDAEAGTAAVEQVDAPLMSDGYELKDGEVVEMANPEIVPAGGASVTDDVIKSGMNYNVAGVVEG